MNWIVRFVLIVAMAALTSFGTTSPRYSMQRAGAGRYGVALHDLVNRLEAGVRDLGHKKVARDRLFRHWSPAHASLSPSGLWDTTLCSSVYTVSAAVKQAREINQTPAYN